MSFDDDELQKMSRQRQRTKIVAICGGTFAIALVSFFVAKKGAFEGYGRLGEVCTVYPDQKCERIEVSEGEEAPAMATFSCRTDSCAERPYGCLVTSKGSYCSRSCVADNECPAPWTCVGVLSGPLGGTGKKMCTKSP
jgi:hypothetical protein